MNIGPKRFGSQGSPDARRLTAPADIADEGLGYSGTWTWRFAPEGAGTRVTLTEDGEVSNLLFRFLARFVFGYTKSIEEALQALG